MSGRYRARQRAYTGPLQFPLSSFPAPLDKSKHFGRATRVLLCHLYVERLGKTRQPRPVLAQLKVCAASIGSWEEIWAKQSGYCLCHGKQWPMRQMVMFHTVEVPET